MVFLIMGTICAPLFADFFSSWYDRDLMVSLFANNQADIIDAFNSIRPDIYSRYSILTILILNK